MLRALARALRDDSASATMVVFLGDNVYPAGIPADTSPNRGEAERRLRAQVDVVQQSGAHAVFLAGNHDWGASAEGTEALLRQDSLLRAWSGASLRLSPRAGCAGPEVLEIAGRLRLVALDTERWLRADAGEASGSDCADESRTAILDRLGSALATDQGGGTIVVGHHPLRSGGKHGGYFSLMQHLFPLREWRRALWLPLPLFGSAYVALRQTGVPGFASHQDLRAPWYRELRHDLDSVFRTHPTVLLYAAGHEHSLQVLPPRDGQPWLAVSGAGIEGATTPVRRLTGGCYAASRAGWIRLEVSPDRRVTLSVETVDRNGQVSRPFTAEIGGATSCPLASLKQ